MKGNRKWETRTNSVRKLVFGFLASFVFMLIFFEIVISEIVHADATSIIIQR